ncbi:MAG: type IV pilus modification protein PilV [Gammaproteobacteria bacterium]|nr:type IV pilus modification protein PilV [Gammaproteobacteria bacterium]
MFNMINTKKQQGLTLVEVMVALVILSVGLLGLAGLQISGIRGASGSNYRVQAVLAANDLADRMHTNVSSVDDDNSFAAQAITTDDCANNAPAAVDCTANNCSNTQMAAFDLNDVCLNVASTLPQPATITTTCVDNNTGDGDVCTNGSTHTINITWNEVTDTSVNGGNRVQTVNIVVTP